MVIVIMTNEDSGDNYIKGLTQEMEQYNAGLAPPVAEPPQTFVIECNKTMAQEDGNAERTNAWTNSFPPIKLKKGDVVSVNSAFLSTRGSGDLLQFDDTNNKTRLLFEYYATNDNVNCKKPSYNIRGFSNSSSFTYTDGVEQNCYPVNYRPMRLYRLVETFKNVADYTPYPLPVKTTAFTDPDANDPFYSKTKEAFWGYKHSDDFIFNGVEDKYIPSLFRPPLVNIRETQFCAFESVAPLDPTTEPYFGVNLKGLRVWYVSTQHSSVGACNINATMRIYFGYSKNTAIAELEEMNTSTFEFLKRIRVGQFIQFKDADQVFGIYGDQAKHKKTTDGTIIDVGGSSCYYCSGYETLGEGVVRGDGQYVDRFTQFGKAPPALSTGTPTNLYDMSLKNPLGSILKIVKINMANGLRDERLGVAPNYTTNDGINWNDHGHMNMPWIEVQCDSAISIAFNNPNLAHSNMRPSMGNTVVDNSPTLEGISLYTSPRLQIGLRTWMCGANKQLTRTAKLEDGSVIDWQYRNEYGTADVKPYPTNEYENTTTELNEKFYLAFRPNYYSVQDGTPEVDGDYYGSPNADKYASMDNAYGMRLVEDDLGNYGLPDNPTLAMMTGRMGITAGESRIVAHNYNFGTLNKDGTVNSDKYANDILADATYKGGRSPDFFKGGFKPEVYDTPLSSATRIGYHNQGQSYRIWSEANNRTRSGGFFNANASTLRNLEDRTPIHQKKLQTDGNLYIESQNGLNTHFHFGNTILDTDVVYNGDPMINQLVAPFSEALKASNINFANGTANFIVGAKNLPKAYAKDGGTDFDYQSGLWYGYADPTANVFRRPYQKGGYGLDRGIFDFRYPMSQLPSLFYARFTNAQGETEVMYCQCIFQRIETNDGTTNADYDSGGFTNFYHDPSISFVSAVSPLDDCCAPALYIIKRDCENKGRKKFLGIDANSDGSMRTFDINQYNPKISEPTNVDKPTQLGSYFEILNDYAMAEHQLRFDNLERDLIPLSPLNMTEDTEWDENYAVNTSQFGNPCGGDFYLCKYPNMPFLENDTGIRRVVDNQIRLCAENIKMGEPTRIDGISNYTGVGHTGKYEWDIHYDYIDLDISGDKVYYSPSDVANFITNQLHKPADLYKSWDMTNGGGGRYEGGQWKHSAGSYPMNSLFRTIHGPSDEVSGGENGWDNATGMLKNTYHEGDFVFFSDIAKEVFENGINAFGFEGGGLMGLFDEDIDIADANSAYQVPSGGKHPVWIPNNNFYLNTLPTTDSFNIDGYGYSQAISQQTIRNFYNEEDMRGKTMKKKQYTFSQTFGSMFVGTNNAQLAFNTNVNRFEWKFLHQPNYSIFNQDHTTGATSGGNIIAKIWTERIRGYDNWDKYGGVNIINWSMPIIQFGQARSRRDVVNDPLTYKDPIGNAFMNKLGFSNTWINANQGSTDYDDVSTYSYTTCYKPLGTTSSDYDISQAKPYTQKNPLLLLSNVGDDARNSYLPPTTDAEKVAYLSVDNSLNSLGGMVAPPPPLSATSANLSYGGAVPYGNQQGTDATFDRSDFFIKNLGASLGYGFVNTMGTPPSVRYEANTGTGLQAVKVPTDLNLDDVKFFSYDIEVDSNSIQADELPKKTLIGYFLIMSDIIDKHEFIGSANNGSPLNCIGILSKNYENSDFYFSFQSPVEFYIKQDRTITSIKTEIMTPQLTNPSGLDTNSSIIYTIVRQNNVPEPDVPPIAIQQALDYALMEKMSGQMGIDMGQINPYSNAGQLGLGQGSGGGAGLNTLRQNLVDAVLHPSQGSASMIFATQSGISATLGRMNLSQRTRMLKEGLSTNPQDPLLEQAPPAPAQAQIEGLGIAQPEVSEEYVSEDQLQIEAQNAIKGKPPQSPDSAMGESVFSFMGGLKNRRTSGRPARSESDGTAEGSSIPDLTSDFGEIEESDIQSKGSVPTGTIGEFFGNYMKVANKSTKSYFSMATRIGKFDVDNPNSWSKELLTQWDSDWGEKAYKGIGMKLGAEAKGRIKSALSRYETLSTAEIAEASSVVDKPVSRTVAPEDPIGRESLTKRISRSVMTDPRTRPDEKKVMSWEGQNPYDLRTWHSTRLTEYTKDPHYGIEEKHRTAGNKLHTQATKKLKEEKDRRDKGGKGSGKIQLNPNKEYKNKSQAPTGYDPHAQHKTPHASIDHKYKIQVPDRPPPIPQFKEGGSK